jgi:acrylyl-CoA reductase (NADPH)
MPFILRGACLLGIDSGYIGEPYRSGVWQRLASDLRPQHLQAMTRTIAFDELPKVFDDFLKGRAHGRVVVECAGALKRPGLIASARPRWTLRSNGLAS